ELVLFIKDGDNLLFLFMLHSKANPPQSPFTKGEAFNPPLCKRGVRGDLPSACLSLQSISAPAGCAAGNRARSALRSELSPAFPTMKTVSGNSGAALKPGR